MKILTIATTVLAMSIGMSSATAQTSPQTTPDQTMPAQPDSAQPMPDQMGTQPSPSTQAPDATVSLSDADKRKIGSCLKKSPEAMAKDKKCVAIMEAHPEMTTPAPSQGT